MFSARSVGRLVCLLTTLLQRWWIHFTNQVTWLASPRYKAQAPFVCRYVAPPGECYYNTVLCCDYFSSSSVKSRAFSALCVYSKFGHHHHPPGYLCAKFRFFRGLHCCASPWWKTAYSITHPAYLMAREPKRLLFGISLSVCPSLCANK